MSKRMHCKHCRDNMWCKLQEEGCNGDGKEMVDCLDYNEGV